MLLGNQMALLQELRQMRCLLATTRATKWAGVYADMPTLLDIVIRAAAPWEAFPGSWV